MRRTPPPIHLLAAAAATDNSAAAATTFIMSSHSRYRGRGSGFSGRSYSGGRGQFVTGDDHFQSVRDDNLGFRRGEKGSFENQTQYHPQYPPFNPRPPPPPHHHSPQFRHPHPPYRPPPPPHHHNPQFRHPHPSYRPPPPYGHNRQEFHPPRQPRPRAPDYRDWEPATTPPPPPHCERFRVLSYNILADYLALDHQKKLYFHIRDYMLDWHWRQGSILTELGWWSADILCLQEVDRFHDLAEELKLKGYSGIWKMRTGNPVDGCAIFWRISRFNLLYEECIEFNKLGLRDNVAQICVLEFIDQNGSLPKSSLTGYSKIVVCNIHVLYNPRRGEIKLGQVRVLLDRAKAVSELWNNAPVVICGDFNCTPKSPLYNFISEQKLDLSGIDRDKVSGQASATIFSPRLYRPNSSERSADGSVQTTSIEGDKEVNIKQNNYLSDMQHPDTKSNSSGKQYPHAVLDMSDKSWTNVQCGKESDAYAGKDTQYTAVEQSKIFGEVDSIKEGPNPSYSEARVPIDHINDEIYDITPITSSALEAVPTDTTELCCTEHISDLSTSNQESLSKESNVYAPEGNKHMEFDCSPTSLQEDNQSSKVKIDLESTDLLNMEISTAKPSSKTSVSDAFEVTHPGYRESQSYELIVHDQMNSPSTSDLVDKQHQSTSIDFPLDEKLEKLFLDEIDKALISHDNTGEDDNAFISSLHNAEGITLGLGPSIKSDIEKSFQFDESDSASNNLLLPAESNEVEDGLSPSLSSKSIDAENTTYNPSVWTPMEIETATGNADCTFLEHPLPLRSAYTEAVDCSGTRDPHGEPLVTSYNRRFLGTVDYIWRSEGLQTTRVLAPIPKHVMQWTPGFPTKKWGSDHIALVSELALLKDGNDINRDV